jgi:lysine 2,3-aminomutase
VRNQGVVMRGVNATPSDLLDLCFALHGEAGVLPYYFYLCDVIPHAEHWRIPLHEAQRLQEAIMGYLPGYATPRLVCDVPYVGKRWVHQAVHYDRVRGISYWTKSYRTVIENDLDVSQRYPYYDPIASLPEAGRAWWTASSGANGARTG